ncbi:MAG: hypothetical protein CMJ49_12450 [Planctomycetaceae bacterium]|nr:hypothetical protein [Planctomycetaceae bacterium]
MPALICAALIVLLEGLTFAMVFPVLTDYTQELGGSVALAGLMFALVTLPKVVMNPLWGGLSERWGRRLAMALITLGTLTGSVLWALSKGVLNGVLLGGLGWLIVSRVIAGVFSAQAALSYAIASDVSTTAKRTASLGVLGAAFGLAFTVGPAVGGIVADETSAQMVGWVCAGCQGLSLLIIAFGLRETRPVGDGGRAAVETVGGAALLGRRAVRGMLGVILLMTVAYGVLIPTFKPIVEDWYDWDVRQAGWALSLFGLVGVIVQGGVVRPLSKRIDNWRLGLAGLMMMSAGLVWIAAHPSGDGVFIVAMVLLAVGTSVAMPAITSMLSHEVGEDGQGVGHGLGQSATSIGRAAGFGISGVLFAYGAAWPYWAGAAVGGIALMVLIGAGRPAGSRNDG